MWCFWMHVVREIWNVWQLSESPKVSVVGERSRVWMVWDPLGSYERTCRRCESVARTVLT